MLQTQEIQEALSLIKSLTTDFISNEDMLKIQEIVEQHLDNNDENDKNDTLEASFGLDPILFNLQTAIIAVNEIGQSRPIIISILMHEYVNRGMVTLDEIKQYFGEDIMRIINGLQRVKALYARNTSIETENFRDLLLSFAEDMRVIFIIIADRVNLMRQIKDRGTEEDRYQHNPGNPGTCSCCR